MTCENMSTHKLLHYLTSFLMFLFVIPGSLLAADNLTIKSESLIRFMERDTSKEVDALIVPAYEYLQFELGDEELSFHANGWGRMDLTDNDFYKDQSTGELLYGYLQYRPVDKGVTVRLGRQTIIAGVTHDSLDGLYLRSTRFKYFSFSLYAGQPVSLDNSNGRDGDSLYGGRLGLRLGSRHTVGFSYKMIENDSIEAAETAGIDLGLSFNSLYINGTSSYNLISEGFSEHSYEALFGEANSRYRIFYQLFTFDDYFATGANNANPFRILAQTSEELMSYGLETTWKSSDSFESGIKLVRHDYDLKEASHYAGLLAAWHGEGLTSVGGELGFSEGENGRNDMLLVRCYGFKEMTNKTVLDQISLDILYALYDQAIFGEDTSTFVSFSGRRKIINDNFTLKAAVDYESGPYFDSDIRGLVSLIYHYSK